MIVPDIVRRRAESIGATAWLEGLPAVVAELEEAWGMAVGRTLSGGSEALVVLADVAGPGGVVEPAVLKVLIPAADGIPTHEATALALAAGEGCPRLLRHHAGHGALLLERLGRPLAEQRLTGERRDAILGRLAARVWRPAAGAGLPTGAEKGRWLAGMIPEAWEATARPCSERAIRHALDCVARRVAAHDDERAVLVHGDVHEWNALEAGDGTYKLIDPDGLLAEPAYDLGVVVREEPAEGPGRDPWDRVRALAAATGVDATAIWEWSVVERVSTGLTCTRLDLQPDGRTMLATADRLAGGSPSPTSS
jgi:streptomycin 6-kinase